MPREEHTRARAAIRFGAPVVVVVAFVALLAILWFPFDWLSAVWPAFGVPFREVFHNAHDHFIGHTIFFFLVGFFVLALIPALRRRPQWYFPGLAVAALAQETIQALFRGEAPTFTDFNAFKGDALGGISAFALWLLISLFQRVIRQRTAASARSYPSGISSRSGERTFTRKRSSDAPND